MITPSIRQNLQLLPGTPAEDGSPSWLLYDNLRNKYFTLGINAFRMLKHWVAGVDSKKFIEEIEKKGLSIEEDQLNDFINFLKMNSLISHNTSEDVQILINQHQSQQKHWFLKLIHNYLFFKIPLVKPDNFLDKTLNLAKFFSQKLIKLIIYIFGLIGIYFVIQQWDEFISTFLYFFNWNGFVFYLLALVGVKAIHELGHAYTAKNFGCNVNSMGIAFLVFFPFLYTDNTNAWRLRDHKKRLTINFAGISTELHLALIATFFWGIAEPGMLKSIAFFVATTGWISSLLINISPFMRFDGYYVFADYLKIENLQPRAFALAKWKLRKWIFGFDLKAPEQMNVQKQNLIIAYAWATWIYRFFLFLGIAFLVYYFAFKLLGIFLFVVEIFWFIALPILREMREWWRLRFNLVLSLQLFRSISILLVLSLILFYPWKSYQNIPAVYQSEKFIEIYPPINSKILDIFISEKQKIETKLQNLKKIKKSLEIKAPFKGEITFLNKMKKEQWFNEDTPLLSLVNKSSFQLVAFLSEKEISSLDRSQATFFIPSTSDHYKISAEISDVSNSPVDNFELYPMVTSLYDGPIAARENPSGGIQSERAYYIVTFDIEQDQRLNESKIAGVINVGVKPYSFFNQFLDFAAATLIREISF